MYVKYTPNYVEIQNVNPAKKKKKKKTKLFELPATSSVFKRPYYCLVRSNKCSLWFDFFLILIYLTQCAQITAVNLYIRWQFWNRPSQLAIHSYRCEWVCWFVISIVNVSYLFMLNDWDYDQSWFGWNFSFFLIMRGSISFIFLPTKLK